MKHSQRGEKVAIMKGRVGTRQGPCTPLPLPQSDSSFTPLSPETLLCYLFPQVLSVFAGLTSVSSVLLSGFFLPSHLLNTLKKKNACSRVSYQETTSCLSDCSFYLFLHSVLISRRQHLILFLWIFFL